MKIGYHMKGTKTTVIPSVFWVLWLFEADKVEFLGVKGVERGLGSEKYFSLYNFVKETARNKSAGAWATTPLWMSLFNLHSLSVLFYRYVSGNTGKIQLLNRTTKLAEVNYFFCSLCSLFVVFDSFLIVCILHSYSILFNTLFKPIQRLQPNFTFCQPNHQMIFRKNFSDYVLNLFLFLLLLKMPIA